MHEWLNSTVKLLTTLSNDKLPTILLDRGNSNTRSCEVKYEWYFDRKQWEDRCYREKIKRHKRWMSEKVLEDEIPKRVPSSQFGWLFFKRQSHSTTVPCRMFHNSICLRSLSTSNVVSHQYRYFLRITCPNTNTPSDTITYKKEHPSTRIQWISPINGSIRRDFELIG